MGTDSVDGVEGIKGSIKLVLGVVFSSSGMEDSVGFEGVKKVFVFVVFVGFWNVFWCFLLVKSSRRDFEDSVEEMGEKGLRKSGCWGGWSVSLSECFRVV